MELLISSKVRFLWKDSNVFGRQKFSKNHLYLNRDTANCRIAAVAPLKLVEFAANLPSFNSDVLFTSLGASASIFSSCETPVVLSQVAFRVLIPCYLMSKVSTVLAMHHTGINIAAIPLIAIAQISAGALLGKLACATLYHIPNTTRKQLSAKVLAKKEALVTISCAFGNTLSLPLVFIRGILSPRDASLASGYLALFIVGWSPFLWTVAYQILSSSVQSQDIPEKQKHFVDSIIRWYKRLLNPPLFGVLLGTVLGLSPVSKFLTLDHSSENVPLVWKIFHPVYDAGSFLGSAAPAIQVIVLACSLAGVMKSRSAKLPHFWGPRKIKSLAPALAVMDSSVSSSSHESTPTLIGRKELVAICFIAERMKILTMDPICKITLLVLSSMPSAQNLVVLAQLRPSTRPLAKELAELLLFQPWYQSHSGSQSSCQWNSKFVDMSLAICDAPVPKFVVGLDFGTTYSGFAYAHRIDTKDVNLLYDWPCSPRPYCKTQTSLFYTPGREDDSFKLEDWGWAATKKFMESRPSSQDEIGFLVNKFKLRLAEDFSDGNKAIQDSFAGKLEVERLVVDYLASISKFIVEHLKGTYGQSFSARDVQWCLTVPAIWSDKAKHKMQVYAEKAKLVRGKFCSSSKASMYPLRIILEPEAASFSCQMELGRIISLAPGDKFLVADIGGGTIDIVVHEKESSAPGKHEVHEVSASSGELGGGTYVDRNFMEFLEKKIGCFRRFCQQEQSIVYHRILMWWLGPDGKCTFNGSCPKLLEVPKKLSKAWKKHDKTVRGFAEDDDYYDEIKICCEQMEAIFDTEVDKTIRLIQEKLDKVDDIKYIFLVGGFASSPYLRSRIKNRFEGVARVVSHPNPGGAICSGAVALGYGTGVVLSRISKHSYGISSSRNFHRNDPPAYKFFDDNGLEKCRNIFSLFVEKEGPVSVNQSVTHSYFPIFRHQKVLKIALFSSSSDFIPMYTTDEGCVELDSYEFDIGEDLHMGTGREVEVTMFFGRSTIEVSARRVNFGSNREPEKLYFVEFDAPETYVNKNEHSLWTRPGLCKIPTIVVYGWSIWMVEEVLGATRHLRERARVNPGVHPQGRGGCPPERRPWSTRAFLPPAHHDEVLHDAYQRFLKRKGTTSELARGWKVGPRLAWPGDLGNVGGRGHEQRHRLFAIEPSRLELAEMEMRDRNAELEAAKAPKEQYRRVDSGELMLQLAIGRVLGQGKMLPPGSVVDTSRSGVWLSSDTPDLVKKQAGASGVTWELVSLGGELEEDLDIPRIFLSSFWHSPGLGACLSLPAPPVLALLVDFGHVLCPDNRSVTRHFTSYGVLTAGSRACVSSELESLLYVLVFVALRGMTLSESAAKRLSEVNFVDHVVSRVASPLLRKVICALRELFSTGLT
ncbi:hypothetical protein SELMODRAFT_414734 [Selaginella moellendorffii]|uniref:Uncharacterized protein n=1 Tax=Selaginella moellendorffii TaxID=88036 RepID=D8RTS1_SELML|nr:hypothetical protein SELMODRAFT_414734 [Selaginella moellendorffii]